MPARIGRCTRLCKWHSAAKDRKSVSGANSPPQPRRGGRDIKQSREATLAGADGVVLARIFRPAPPRPLLLESLSLDLHVPVIQDVGHHLFLAHIGGATFLLDDGLSVVTITGVIP